MSLEKRYDFVLLFDVKDGNPNGDPDAGNLPRLDAETGHGLVTDVCLKRKVRNFVALKSDYKAPHNIYIREKAVLGRAHFDAFRALGIDLGDGARVPIEERLAEQLQGVELMDGLTLEQDDGDANYLVVSATCDKKAAKTWLKEADLDKAAKKVIADALKGAKARPATGDESTQGREWLCNNYFDIRTFGAVLSLKTAPNCGQVRGPVQLTFARSVTPVVSLEHSITRMAVATEAEAEKQGGDNRTMGRKFTVPYGLYVAHGFVSAPLAQQTGFSAGDLELFWEALINMFEHDRSAARGMMATRGLYVFEHESRLGNAPAHALFERVRATLRDSAAAPRSFSDYAVEVDETNLPGGVKLIRKVG